MKVKAIMKDKLGGKIGETVYKEQIMFENKEHEVQTVNRL